MKGRCAWPRPKWFGGTGNVKIGTVTHYCEQMQDQQLSGHSRRLTQTPHKYSPTVGRSDRKGWALILGHVDLGHLARSQVDGPLADVGDPVRDPLDVVGGPDQVGRAGEGLGWTIILRAYPNNPSGFARLQGPMVASVSIDDHLQYRLFRPPCPRPFRSGSGRRCVFRRGSSIQSLYISLRYGRHVEFDD